MSFSVQVGAEHIEWSGSSLNTVFAQRANIVNPKFLSMLPGVLKFSRDADRLLADPTIDEITLGQLIEREGYSAAFTDWYLLPMGDAIWSTPPGCCSSTPPGRSCASATTTACCTSPASRCGEASSAEAAPTWSGRPRAISGKHLHGRTGRRASSAAMAASPS